MTAAGAMGARPRFGPWAAALLLFTVACAQPQEWVKPGATRDQWARDRADCQTRARAEAERRFRERASETDSPVYGGGQTLAKSMARHDATRLQRSLLERCLRARGYTKRAPEPEEKT